MCLRLLHSYPLSDLKASMIGLCSIERNRSLNITRLLKGEFSSPDGPVISSALPLPLADKS
jgi:hypothetical protein